MFQYPHVRLSYYTGNDAPSKHMNAHQWIIPAWNASCGRSTCQGAVFWNVTEAQVIDSVPTSPIFAMGTLGMRGVYEVDHTPRDAAPYWYESPVLAMIPAFDEASELELVDTGLYRVKTLVWLEKFKPHKWANPHVFFHRYVLKENFFQVDPIYFNDKPGMQHLYTGVPKVYKYNPHLCSHKQADWGQQLVQYVHVANYPACNSSADYEYYDVIPTLGMALGFNSPSEFGMFVTGAPDGVYKGFQLSGGAEDLLPMFNLRIGLPPMNDTKFRDKFLGEVVNAIVLDFPYSGTYQYLSACIFLIISFIACVKCMTHYGIS